MFSIGWMEVAVLMTIGVFFMTVFLTIFGAVMKQRSAPVPPSAPRLEAPMQSRPRPVTGLRLPLLVTALLLTVLTLLAPMPWLLFGQAGMPFVRLAVIGILLVALLLVALAAITVASQISTTSAQMGNAPLAAHDPATHFDLVSRITQRFCPRCRAPLAADSPEGLCPACLMAGGLASGARFDAHKIAVTTPPSGSQPPTPSDWANLAEHFPQLEILELLGRGGMGAVYKVRQKNLDRLIALKVIPPEAAKDPAFAERFAREARAMARLNHPNIVTVYDFGQAGDIFYLLMEYVDGINLRDTMRAARLQPKETLAIVPQICDALQYAHDQGVVHRDIKPENVLLDRSGRVKIADFGLAKLLGKGPANFTLTQSQQVMGTPRYMAPEQIEKPTSVDHRADIYSLGVVLYEMLTGELPIGRFEPPSHKVQLDVRIDDVVLRTLEKEPDRRYQRASQVKTELASAASWPELADPPRSHGSRPDWETPAPVSKHSIATPPGGVPLGQVLVVAMGMIVGAMMMTAGLAAGLYCLLGLPVGRIAMFSGPWWGLIGAAFGTLVGGFGSFFGSYNSYRQLAGAEDLMRSPRVTWFDWSVRAYLVLGFGLLALALYFLGLGHLPLTWPLFLLGGIATVQAAAFLLWRVAERGQIGGELAIVLVGVGLCLYLAFWTLAPAWTGKFDHLIEESSKSASPVAR